MQLIMSSDIENLHIALVFHCVLALLQLGMPTVTYTLQYSLDVPT